jgi:hypothetical protein
MEDAVVLLQGGWCQRIVTARPWRCRCFDLYISTGETVALLSKVNGTTLQSAATPKTIEHHEDDGQGELRIDSGVSKNLSDSWEYHTKNYLH